MSGTAIFAMTLISAAATIAIGGYDILGSSMQKTSAKSAPASPGGVLGAIASAVTGSASPTASAAAPIPHVEKSLDANETFVKWIHDTIASPQPLLEAKKTSEGVVAAPFCTSIVKFTTHQWTLEAMEANAEDKFLAALVLLARKNADLVVDKGFKVKAKAPAGSTGPVSTATWSSMLWGNRPMVVLARVGDNDSFYDACVMNVKTRVGYFVTTNMDESNRANVEYVRRAENLNGAGMLKVLETAMESIPDKDTLEKPQPVPIGSDAPPSLYGGASTGSAGTASGSTPLPTLTPDPTVEKKEDYKRMLKEYKTYLETFQSDFASVQRHAANGLTGALMVADAASKLPSNKAALEQFLSVCSITILPSCRDRKGVFSVLAALMSETGGEVKDHLDRLNVLQHEAEDAWMHAMDGLKDHGKNMGYFDKQVRPGREELPADQDDKNKDKNCPPKFNGDKNSKREVQEYEDKVYRHNRKHGTNCSDKV